MKNIKLFKQYLFENNDNIISSSELINITYDIHRDPNDFYDTDEFSGLQTLINKYDSYILKDININDIPKQYTNYSEDKVRDYIKMYKQNNNYPPIIYDPELKLIIDGIHRYEALKRLGINKIKSYVGRNLL